MMPMLLFIWILSSIFLLRPIILKIINEHDKALTFDTILTVTIWVMYFPFFLLVILNKTKYKVEPEILMSGMLFILICNILFSFGKSVISFKRSSNIYFRYNQHIVNNRKFVDGDLLILHRKIKNYIKICSVIGIIGFFVFIFSFSKGLDTARLSRLEAKTSISYPVYFIGVMMVDLLGIAVVGIIYLRKYYTRTYRYSLLLLYISICIMSFVFMRSRTMLLAAIIIPIFSINLNRLTRMNLIKIAVVGLFIIAFASYIKGLRGYIQKGYSAVKKNVEDRSVVNTLSDSIGSGDLAFGKTFFEAFEKWKNDEDYLYGDSYFWWPVFFIPRKIIPFKPINTQIIFCRKVNPAMASVGGTIPPTIYGDAWINFGNMGVMVFFFFGIFVGFIDNIFFSPYSKVPYQFVMIVIVAFTAMHFARGGFHNAMSLLFCQISINAVLINYLKI